MDRNGLPAYLQHRLHFALNAASRLIYYLEHCDHIIDDLNSSSGHQLQSVSCTIN